MNGREFQQKVIAARDAILAEDESLTSLDPTDVAARLLTGMSRASRESLLRLILPDAVRRVLNDPPAPTKEGSESRAISSVSESDPDQATTIMASASKGTTLLPGPSKRSIAAFFKRTYWAPEFGDQHHMLGMMTAEMVGQVAAYRSQQGADVTAQALRLKTLQQLMLDEHVEKVSDLPVEKVKDILSGGVR